MHLGKWLTALALGFLVYKMGIVIIVPHIRSPNWPSPLLYCLGEYGTQVPALWEVPLAALHYRAKGVLQHNQGHEGGREG